MTHLLAASDACPCGSGEAFAVCCERFLNATALPASPEQLMRSRYSAFFTSNAEYLRSTWHPGTAPDHLELEDDVQWLGLRILDAPPPVDGAKRGVVEFVATYCEDGEEHELHERSRFAFQSNRWWYLDGVHEQA